MQLSLETLLALDTASVCMWRSSCQLLLHVY